MSEKMKMKRGILWAALVLGVCVASARTVSTGIGGTYLPKRRLGSGAFRERDASDPDVTIEAGGRGTLDVAAGECRLLLVPEYAVTERWCAGAGVVVAF